MNERANCEPPPLVVGHNPVKKRGSDSPAFTPERIALIAIGMLFAVCGAWYLGHGSKGDAQSSLESSPVSGRIGNNIGSTRGEGSQGDEVLGARDKLKEEIKALEQSKRLLEGETQRLQKQRDELQVELQKLATEMNTLRRFGTAQFVLVNPGHLAVGMQQENDGAFHILEKADGDLAERVLRLLRRDRIPRIGSDRQLTQEVYATHSAGQTLALPLASRLSEHWCQHRYLPFPPEAPLEFVCFRDLAMRSYRTAVFLGVNGSQMRCITVSQGTEESIPQSRVAAGTACKGAGSDILAMAPEVEFFDFCLLNIAHKLGSPGDRPTHVALAIRVKTDFPPGRLREYQQRGFSLRIGPIAFSFVGGPNGISLEEKLQQLVVQVEDEVYARLAKLRVRVLEREELSEVQAERALSGKDGFETRRYGDLLCASHVAVIELGQGRESEAWRASVRLVSADSGEVVWAETHEEPLRGKVASNDYLLHATSLFVINNAARDRGQKGLPLFLPTSAPQALTATEPRVMCSEPCDDPAYVQIRDLFDRRTHRLLRSQINVEAVKRVERIEDVPANNVLRYVVWRIARSILPLGGHVVAVRDNRATITLGSSCGTKTGDKFGVFRIVDGNPGDDEQLQQQRALSLELVATDTSQATATTIFRNSGVEILWSGNEEPIKGDIVVPRRAAPCELRILPVVVGSPGRDVERQLRLDNVVRNQQVYRDTQEAATVLRRKLRDGLMRLNVAVLEEEVRAGLGRVPSSIYAGMGINGQVPEGTSAADRATHVLRGTITPSAGQTFSVHVTVYIASSETPIESLTFRVTAGQLKEWVA